MKFFNVKNSFMWLSILGTISLVFGILFRIFGAHWLYVVATIPWIPIGIFIVVGVIFTWIINPIRRLIQKRKDKEK